AEDLVTAPELYDLQGRLLPLPWQRQGRQHWQASLPPLPPGLYLVRVMDRRGQTQVVKWQQL
ncbi:MAG: T9SS C-terminal target domain-containing protein, partial [Bacteroidetes bacterium]